MAKYRYFLFTGDHIVVEDETLGKAIETAKIYFADPSYMGYEPTLAEIEENIF